jgi:hypothetical protein
MNEPVRLRESGTADVRALLKHAERPRPMAADEYARGERRVARLAAVPVGLGLLFWLKGIALGAGLGAVAVAGVIVVQSAQTPSSTTDEPTPQGEPRVMAPLASAPIPAASSSPEPSQSEAVPAGSSPSLQEIPAPAPEQSDAGSDAGGDSLAEEAALVESARGALGSDPSRALALTREHAQRFPTGQLGMEREIVAIQALQKLGRSAEARERADALLRAAPGGLYEERIRNLFPQQR